MQRPILVVASSGGHLTQAMCATSTIDSPMVLVCNKNMLDDSPFCRVHVIRDTQHNVVIHLLNLVFALRVLWREKPTAVFSTGGPIVLPFALLSKILRIRFIFLDTMSRVTELSNSGKMIHRFKLYDSFFCQWQSVADQYSGVEYHGKAFDLGHHGHQ